MTTIVPVMFGWNAQMGDMSQAEALLEDALAQHREVTGPYGVAVALYFLGNVKLASGDRRRAIECHREALGVFADASDWTNVARSAEGIAHAIVTVRPKAAVRLFGAAAAMRGLLDHPMYAEDVPRYEDALAEARRRMTEAAFASAWAEVRVWPGRPLPVKRQRLR